MRLRIGRLLGRLWSCWLVSFGRGGEGGGEEEEVMAQMSFSLVAADIIALANWYDRGLFSIGSMRAFGFLFWGGGRSIIGMVKERRGWEYL